MEKQVQVQVLAGPPPTPITHIQCGLLEEIDAQKIEDESGREKMMQLIGQKMYLKSSREEIGKGLGMARKGGSHASGMTHTAKERARDAQEGEL